MDDAVAAYRWLLKQRGGPGGVVVMGDSAGGGLVMSLLLAVAEQGLPMPAGAALLCPLVDLTGAHVRDVVPTSDAPAVTTALMRQLGGLYLAGHPADDPAVAPLLADLTGLPPLLIQAGTGDGAVGDAEALAERATAHGVAVTTELYPVDTHVFHVFWPFLPEAGQAVAAAGDFVRDVLAQEGGTATG